MLVGAAETLTPTGNLKKYVRLAGAFCLLCALVTPITSWLSKNQIEEEVFTFNNKEYDNINYDEIYNISLCESGRKDAEARIKQAIQSQFHFSSESLEVQVQTELKNDNLELSGITLILKEEAIFTDPRDLIAYVDETWNCSCTVLYD